MESHPQGSLLHATLLVAGTTIGGGMLAAPVLMGGSGFVPSLLVYLIVWLVMVSTGLLMLEACLWMKRETNLLSLAGMTLGKAGRIAAWSMYLFQFYCLTLAYVVGGGELLAGVFTGLSSWSGSLVFVLIFGFIVFCGARLVGWINLPLMFGLGVSYLAFVILGYRYINFDLLKTQHWSQMLSAFPIAFAAFGFQGIVPTLSHYLGYNARQARLAIILGTFIPFIVYSVWQGLILGIVPLQGPGGLEEAQAHGYLAVTPLKEILQSPQVFVLGEYFAFFALTTSFLGVTLGLIDFLADGLQIRKTVKGRCLLSVLVFAPPLLLSWVYPDVFLKALEWAGGLGVAFLLGLLPVLMVWSGRYRLGLEGQQLLPGGRWVLGILVTVISLELGVEIVRIIRIAF